MTTATIDLPDVSQPFEWGDDSRGLLVLPSAFLRPRVRLLGWQGGSGVALHVPTDDARKLAAYIWAAAAEADARAEQ
jgi:hypothetical protein